MNTTSLNALDPQDKDSIIGYLSITHRKTYRLAITPDLSKTHAAIKAKYKLLYYYILAFACRTALGQEGRTTHVTAVRFMVLQWTRLHSCTP